ncbi:metallopeptidase [Desmophyllum pertusum]|uniref:Metallopeptidase n=1 Tax=Desmophyllum pertusum TaxID=174260 RepID=A0A9X0CUY8_9CNID|nr:metallopeptidase [Desmophyllum pertusum]
MWPSKQLDPLKKKQVVLQRSCKLLVHEIAHLFGVNHCIWFSCCMNGSGHLSEDFAQPIYLCPVDLHKLQHLCGFDVVDRYRKLLEFFKRHGMTDEAQWFETRLEFITTSDDR